MKALENEITTHNLLFLIILFLGEKVEMYVQILYNF